MKVLEAKKREAAMVYQLFGEGCGNLYVLRLPRPTYILAAIVRLDHSAKYVAMFAPNAELSPSMRNNLHETPIPRPS
jgi:hypothetical protein